MPIPAGKPSSTDEAYIIGQWGYLYIQKDAQGRDEPSPVKKETFFTAGQITLKKKHIEDKKEQDPIVRVKVTSRVWVHIQDFLSQRKVEWTCTLCDIANYAHSTLYITNKCWMYTIKASSWRDHLTFLWGFESNERPSLLVITQPYCNSDLKVKFNNHSLNIAQGPNRIREKFQNSDHTNKFTFS